MDAITSMATTIALDESPHSSGDGNSPDETVLPSELEIAGDTFLVKL